MTQVGTEIAHKAKPLSLTGAVAMMRQLRDMHKRAALNGKEEEPMPRESYRRIVGQMIEKGRQ